VSAAAGTAPLVSIVTPVYNGATFIEESVRVIRDTLDASGRSFELIVVSDGSTDATFDRAAAVQDPRVRVLRYPVNEGKGFAIAHGLAQARGRLVGWIDADLDIHPSVLVEAIARFEAEPVDAVVGSKRHPRSAVDYPRIRRVYSWGFQMLVRVLFRVNVRDTQVGAKLFRREMLETVGSLLLIKRYAFDLEVLAVGAEFGFDRVAEAPVRLDYRFTGTSINTSAVWRMLVDTLAIAYRIHVRHWYVRRFAALHRHRLDDIGTGALVAFADDPRAEPVLPTADPVQTA
jgi:glycosyltransferase involved in cell wall biosynthesis